MIDINNWLGVRENKQKDIRYALNIYNEYLDRDWQNKNVSFCFLSISDNGKYILICIHKKDKEEDVEHGIRRYNKAIEDNMNVILYNYQNNKFKKWNRFSKQESEGDIGLVDYDSLIEVIKEIQNINNPLFLKAKKFNRFFYAVIYKLLKEGIFGVVTAARAVLTSSVSISSLRYIILY